MGAAGQGEDGGGLAEACGGRLRPSCVASSHRGDGGALRPEKRMEDLQEATAQRRWENGLAGMAGEASVDHTSNALADQSEWDEIDNIWDWEGS